MLNYYGGVVLADDDQRPSRHGALADPNRLAIVDELDRSDRSPSELGATLGLAPNLLAHHLRVLEETGLVRRHRSAADRRRSYVSLVHEALADLGPRRPEPAPADVLFVCTHNAARSPLAAALWRRLAGTGADSAGTHPAPQVHPGAVAAARRHQLDLGAATPRSVRRDEPAEVIVTVCDRAREDLRPSGWHWSIADPAEAGTDRAFDAAIAELEDRIRVVLGTPA